MIRCFILLLYACTILGIGYDAGGGDRTTCGRPYRAGRLYQPPCDLGRHGYCTQAGQLYPWRAVRRFVKDNQGLMRRMYGDQRHGHVLRAELNELDDFEEEWERVERERGGYGRWRPTPVRFAKYQHHDDIDNELEDDLDFDHPYEEQSRYLREDLTNDDVLNTKFVISEQEAAIAIKLAELKAAAHFRPIHHKTQRAPSSTPKTTKATTTANPDGAKLSASTAAIRSEATTLGSEANEIGGSEGTTTKLSSFNGTTEVDVGVTEESTTTTITGTTEDSSFEHSTIDTTTDRTTEWPSKKTSSRTTSTPSSTTTNKAQAIKTSTQQALAGDRLGEAGDSIAKQVENQHTAPEKVFSDGNNSDKVEHSDDNLDQVAESSEHEEVYSDGDGNVKQADHGNGPAMLFQDMEEDKKKGGTDYNKMKGINACAVKEEVVAPFWANNTRGEVLALLNMYPFEQYVHWEKCTFEHRQMYCREGCRCEQQYRLHRLLAYDPNNECRGIFSDWFRFPSCCVCKCYDIPPEFRVTSRSPRFQMPYPESEEDKRSDI